MKDFDAWNLKKKKIDISILNLYFKEQEVWWCRSGINIGIEANGKHEEFTRPVLILKKHNKRSCLTISLTSVNKKHESYFEIDIENHPGVFANLSQIKVIDSKRLTSKMFFLNKENFLAVKEKIKKFNSL